MRPKDPLGPNKSKRICHGPPVSVEKIWHTAANADERKFKSKNDKKKRNIQSVPLIVPNENTKGGIRSAFQHHMQEHENRPVNTREILKFKGVEEAGKLLARRSVFISAKVVWADCDQVLENVRYESLSAKKTLLVQPPAQTNCIASKVNPPNRKELTCGYFSRKKVNENLPFDQPARVDLYVVGSVAVSKTGRRIDLKGDSNLQHAVLTSGGLVDRIPIVTVVNDCQVIDLPDDVFTARDLHVDLIVTPTRTIECPRLLTASPGIQWNILTAAKVNASPVLRFFRYKEFLEGVDVALADDHNPPAGVDDEKEE